jgi:hypothetical protein
VGVVIVKNVAGKEYKEREREREREREVNSITLIPKPIVYFP